MTCQQHLSSSSSSSNGDHHAVHNGHPSRAKIHRDQHQIRHRFLHRLGIDKPSITMGTVRTIPKLSTGSNNNQTDVDSSSSTAPTNRSGRHVKFASSSSMTTTVHEIPSHRDYDEETRREIWMGTREIEENARRNRREYLADGCNYQRVTEEHQMMKWHNETDDSYELVHPATYWWRYQQEQDRILREEHAHLFPSSSLSLSSTSAATGMPTIKKSRTAMSLAGMAA